MRRLHKCKDNHESTKVRKHEIKEEWIFSCFRDENKFYLAPYVDGIDLIVIIRIAIIYPKFENHRKGSLHV